MSAVLIDGKKIASEIRGEIADGVAELKASRGITPGLAVILVGEDPASKSYVTAKEKACSEVGIRSFDYRMPGDLPEEALLLLIRELNENPDVHGILVQLPLPKQIREDRIIAEINPDKDVDGFHPVNVGNMCIGEKCFLPCTPHGVIQLLLRSGIETDGKHAVIVGRSNIVGKPLMNLLMQKQKGGNATVTLCHTHTKNLAEYTRQADILIAAAGRPNTITADMVKDSAVVIDVGVNRIEDATCPRGYRLAGDVDFIPVSEKASFITPVPGGVGPMTITMLLWNTLQSASTIHE